MAKTINCHCGEKAVIDYSKGKHKTPFIRCPVHGAIMNRKKTWIDYLLANAKDEDEKELDTKAELTALQESDLDSQNPTVKKSIFSGWGTVL